MGVLPLLAQDRTGHGLTVPPPAMRVGGQSPPGAPAAALGAAKHRAGWGLALPRLTPRGRAPPGCPRHKLTDSCGKPPAAPWHGGGVKGGDEAPTSEPNQDHTAPGLGDDESNPGELQHT